MTAAKELEMLARACKGDAEALDWLQRAIGLFHAVDDIVDEHKSGEFKVTTFVQAMELYCHPFFLKHGRALHAVMRGCVNIYADSVEWERSVDVAQREWADHARHCGLEMIMAVADLMGGWEHRRAVSREWRRYNLAVAVAEKAEPAPAKEKGAEAGTI